MAWKESRNSNLQNHPRVSRGSQLYLCPSQKHTQFNVMLVRLHEGVYNPLTLVIAFTIKH